MNLRKIIICALLTSILFVQEQLLAFLPNIQLTIMLILLFSKVVGFKETILIIILHVILDNLLNGSFTPLIMIPMFLGYSMIPIITSIFLKNAENPLILASFGIFFSILYSIMFTITNYIFLEISLIAYIIADIPFTLLLIISSFLSILLLYKPLYNLLDKLIKNKVN